MWGKEGQRRARTASRPVWVSVKTRRRRGKRRSRTTRTPLIERCRQRMELPLRSRQESGAARRGKRMPRRPKLRSRRRRYKCRRQSYPRRRKLPPQSRQSLGDALRGRSTPAMPVLHRCQRSRNRNLPYLVARAAQVSPLLPQRRALRKLRMSNTHISPRVPGLLAVVPGPPPPLPGRDDITRRHSCLRVIGGTISLQALGGEGQRERCQELSDERQGRCQGIYQGQGAPRALPKTHPPFALKVAPPPPLRSRSSPPLLEPGTCRRPRRPGG